VTVDDLAELELAQRHVDVTCSLLDLIARVDPTTMRFRWASDRRKAEKLAAEYRALKVQRAPGRERRRREAQQMAWRRLGAWYERRREAPDLKGLT
jgi:hypothetical protein